MPRPDLNLLLTLEAVLSEGSVARAARRLRLSPSAMSRALARLRAAMGDPLLVRAGRGLVLTPRAAALRERVPHLLREVEAVLADAGALDLRHLGRTFTIRCSEGFAENFAPPLLARVARDAPRVRLRFVPKADKDATLLRDGTVDLETGVIVESTAPELRSQALFADRFVGVVRRGHPLCRGRLTPPRYAAARHVSVSRGPSGRGLVDEALEPLGLVREVATIVGGFATAVALARASDLVATVPERHTGSLRAGLHTFALPFAAPGITVSLLWHPRMDADPAHRWLRGCVVAACAETGPRGRGA